MMCMCCLKNIVSQSCVEERILLLSSVLPETVKRTPAAADIMVLVRLRGYQLYVWRDCVSCSKCAIWCVCVCVCVVVVVVVLLGLFLFF